MQNFLFSQASCAAGILIFLSLLVFLEVLGSGDMFGLRELMQQLLMLIILVLRLAILITHVTTLATMVSPSAA